MTWIGKLIETRDQLIATVGTSVKDKYLPYKIIIPLKIKQFYRDTKGTVLEVAPENEVIVYFSKFLFFLKLRIIILYSPSFIIGKEDNYCNEKEI